MQRLVCLPKSSFFCTLAVLLSTVSCQKRQDSSQPAPTGTSAVLAIPDERKAPEIEISFDKVDWKNDLYVVNGQPFSGRMVKKYANGQTEMVTELVEGKQHGLTREWHENGKVRVEVTFSNGIRHGDNTYWNPDGSKQKHQLYNRGKVEKEEWFDRPAPPGH